MSELYPLLMRPKFDPRPWGATDLGPIYPNHRFEGKIGEAWLTGDDCAVAKGPLAGRTLAELSAQFGRSLLGDAAPDAHRFPLLLKFLFPREKLSVQVHPDDAGAQRIGEPWGKSECWYVAHAKPGSQIALGLHDGVSLAEFSKSIAKNRAEELLRWVNIYPGEMIYVAGGTIHTLGAGSIILETQQQSDTTFRLYDYGRPRELHVEEGLKVVKLNGPSGKAVRAAPSAMEGGRNVRAPLVAAPHFVVDMFELKDQQSFSANELAPVGNAKSSVQILIALEGFGTIETPGNEPVSMAKGDAVVIPASLAEFSVRPQWTIELLRAVVPGEQLPEPATRM